MNNDEGDDDDVDDDDDDGNDNHSIYIYIYRSLALRRANSRHIQYVIWPRAFSFLCVS